MARGDIEGRGEAANIASLLEGEREGVVGILCVLNLDVDGEGEGDDMLDFHLGRGEFQLFSLPGDIDFVIGSSSSTSILLPLLRNDSAGEDALELLGDFRLSVLRRRPGPGDGEGEAGTGSGNGIGERILVMESERCRSDGGVQLGTGAFQFLSLSCTSSSSKLISDRSLLIERAGEWARDDVEDMEACEGGLRKLGDAWREKRFGWL